MKKTLLMAALAAAVVGGACGCGARTWYCGAEDNPRAVKATLKNGLFTISGTGEMRDYGNPHVVTVVKNGPTTRRADAAPVPWHKVKSSITGVVIENGVTKIGESAFYECTNLASVMIGNSVTEIDDWAFYGCTGLTSITIPDSVTIIGSFVFSMCTSLKSVVLGKSVTDIYSWAFAGCIGLTSVAIPKNVTEIGMGVFKGCTGLTSVMIHNNVTEIGMIAFEGCIGLTSVMIPSSVTEVGNKAFKSCENLISIEVAANNAHYSSKDGVLFNKNKTKLIQYPAGKHGAYTIPDSVTTIGYFAFYNSMGLTSVTIPNSVTDIVDNAFAGCTGLTAVKIPDNVTSIGMDAFIMCTGLTSVMIPNRVTLIERAVFWGCSSVTSVTIPASVTSIGDMAFKNCVGLTSIIVQNTIPPKIGYEAFLGIDGRNACLYVPVNSINAYRAASIWNEFKCVKDLASESQRNDITVIDTDTFDISNELSNENRLIEILKDLFIIGDKENLNPRKHELLEKLTKDNILKSLSVIKSIARYEMRDKSKKEGKHPDLEFQIWKFDNEDNAKMYFDIMKKVVYIKSYYEKPPKLFFRVSDELYYLGTYTYNKRKYLFLAENKLIGDYFSESEVHFPFNVPYNRDNVPYHRDITERGLNPKH